LSSKYPDVALESARSLSALRTAGCSYTVYENPKEWEDLQMHGAIARLLMKFLSKLQNGVRDLSWIARLDRAAFSGFMMIGVPTFAVADTDKNLCSD
jgi:hypothetical protein